jgi:hypothetical protein
MPRPTTTRFAYAVAATMMTGSTALGLLAMFELPVLGFRQEPAPVAAAPAPTTTATTTTAVATPGGSVADEGPVVVVEQIRYVDDYVVRPGTPAAPASTGTSTPASTATAAPTAAPPVATTAAPATTIPPDPTTVAPASTTTRPPSPPGCEEPEWDKDRQSWHCKGD